jgi:hypothetical protein
LTICQVIEILSSTVQIMESVLMALLKPILNALNLDDDRDQVSMIHVKNDHVISPDVFAVTSLASSSIAAAGLALAHYAFGPQYEGQR